MRSVLIHLLRIETVSKLLDCGRKSQNYVHIIIDKIIASQNWNHVDKSTLQCLTCIFCPQLIRNVQIRIDTSSIIAHLVKFDIPRERSLKIDAKNSIYIHIDIMDTNSLIIDMDFLYQ